MQLHYFIILAFVALAVSGFGAMKFLKAIKSLDTSDENKFRVIFNLDIKSKAIVFGLFVVAALVCLEIFNYPILAILLIGFGGAGVLWFGWKASRPKLVSIPLSSLIIAQMESGQLLMAVGMAAAFSLFALCIAFYQYGGLAV